MTLPLLTSSRLRTFRTCARKHQFEYVEKYRVTIEPEALRFGTLVHVGLAAYWVAIRDFSNPLDAALEAMRGRAHDEAEAIRARLMLEAYAARWADDVNEYDVLAVEAEYVAPLFNPATGKTSQTWQLGGKVDAILRRKSDGVVCVCEHKTTVDDITDEAAGYWQKLPLDGQVSGYVIGAETMGYSATEIIYDVLRKPMQRPLLATPTENRKFKKDGTLYANQRSEDETPVDYALRIRAAMAENPAKWIARRIVPRTQSQIADYLASVWAQAKMMAHAENEGYSPPNSDACHARGTCPFWLVCSTGSHPSDHPADYRQSVRTNEELEGVTT